MRSLLTLALALALLTLAVPTTAAPDDPETVDVTLRVAPQGFVVPSSTLLSNPAVWIIDPAETTDYNHIDGIAGCHLDVPLVDEETDVTGVQVLEEANETGCIKGWESTHFEGAGEFVDSIDERDQAWPAAWWLMQKNGEAASVGISALSLDNEDALEFVYYSGL